MSLPSRPAAENIAQPGAHPLAPAVPLFPSDVDFLGTGIGTAFNDLVALVSSLFSQAPKCGDAFLCCCLRTVAKRKDVTESCAAAC